MDMTYIRLGGFIITTPELRSTQISREAKGEVDRQICE